MTHFFDRNTYIIRIVFLKASHANVDCYILNEVSDVLPFSMFSFQKLCLIFFQVPKFKKLNPFSS